MDTESNPPDGSVRRLHTDPKIDSYHGYIPDDWGPTHIEPLPKGTVIERLVLNLAVLWRTASYTAQMPTTAVRAAHAAAIGRGKHVTDDANCA